MKWESERRSDNVEDRRGISLGRGGAIGGGAVVLAVIAALLGAPEGVVRQILSGGGDGDGVTQTENPRPLTPEEQKLTEFVKVVLGSTEDVWTAVLPESSGAKQYAAPKLVLFSDAVQSACGMNSAAVGPFYCPPDRRVYLDLSFFAELDRRFGAPGDFAQAYVIAHEVGHHVQNLLGISARVQAERERVSEAAGNRVSVATELQADCLAGVWAFHANRTRQLLEPGDAEEGLRAASAIGDDRLQKEARGRVVPESFTHGSSAQRVHWFQQGMSNGRVADCDTFATQRL
ncbi:MAG: neutral zinc metallopeptidase [Polyangia bacterium]